MTDKSELFKGDISFLISKEFSHKIQEIFEKFKKEGETEKIARLYEVYGHIELGLTMYSEKKMGLAGDNSIVDAICKLIRSGDYYEKAGKIEVSRSIYRRIELMLVQILEMKAYFDDITEGVINELIGDCYLRLNDEQCISNYERTIQIYQNYKKWELACYAEEELFNYAFWLFQDWVKNCRISLKTDLRESDLRDNFVNRVNHKIKLFNTGLTKERVYESSEVTFDKWI